MRTIIVTGAAGFIASTFVRQRLEAGDSVIALDKLTYAGHLENLDSTTGVSCSDIASKKMVNYHFIKGDISDSGSVEDLLRKYQPTAVVNFAAESHVDNSITNPDQFIETNIRGTFILLNECLKFIRQLKDSDKKKFRYLQVSTDEVYGSLGTEGKFSESTAYAPNSPYSASKAAGDMLVRAWFHTYSFPGIITNCSNNYGPRQFPEKMIPLMITNALNGELLPVYGNGENVRDWIHVEDHCSGVALALENGIPGETYCFGGNSERQNIDVVREICEILDHVKPRPDGLRHSTSIQFVKDRLGHDKRYAIDDKKAAKDLGFVRKHDFRSGLRQTVEWYLENKTWAAAVSKRRE